MASICLYFQVHQPYRLRPYTVFDSDPDYFDQALNRRIVQRIAEQCYLPANRLLLKLIERHAGRFRVSFSLTGVVCDQLQEYAPEALQGFQELARTGCVEFLAETDCHSLSFEYSPGEFRAQVEAHCRRMERLFGQTPTVFRNTELIYSNDLARSIMEMGFNAILCDCPPEVMGTRSPAFPYRSAAAPEMLLLVKHRQLSDDIAFRFNNRNWSEWPLTPLKFAQWVTHVNQPGPLCNLFMDYETIGEHHRGETGIFEFFEDWPGCVLAEPESAFCTCSEAVEVWGPAGELDVPEPISWADTEQDLSAWRGNAMQINALQEVYAIEGSVKQSGADQLLRDWRRLQTSDHFYYMSTKESADGAVHRYFNPYESPYDAYITFMNVLDNVRARVGLPGVNG